MYRIIVADDEMIECIVLEHIIQNNLKNQIELVSSVQDGVSLLKAVEEQKPDIAIVDINMPGLNGLDAIEILKMKNLNLKIIIHTAYSEFSYAQKALQLGASDYLVKPNLKEEIIESIKKICCTLDDERQMREAHAKNKAAAQSLYELSADKWLMSLFLEHPDTECYEILRRYCPTITYGGIFTSWKIKEGESLPEQTLRDIYSSLKEKLRSFCDTICLMYKDLFYCFLIPGEKIKNGNVHDWILALIDCLYREWEKSSIFFLVGVSLWKEEDNFISGIYEARLALQHRDQPGVFFFQFKDTPKEISSFQRPLKEARLLLDGKTEECIRQMRESFSSLALPAHLSAEEILLSSKIRGAVYLLQLREELTAISRETIRKTFEFWKDFQLIETFDDLLSWIEVGIQSLSPFDSQKNVSENPYIANACSYIMENYTRDLPLEEVSDAIGISSFYFSRLLKHEKHTTFVEMLTDIRIQKAMLLLSEDQKSIREIGAVIGYPNQSYFYKVFKKTTGLSLGDVRKYLA
ncbi:MAG: response regulator [Lachnospiraceae bacterium]|nr:response regulator [Robinsoniella sp.]MDY3767496.1 response regulator [Lachnospiraceae bacterium]